MVPGEETGTEAPTQQKSSPWSDLKETNKSSTPVPSSGAMNLMNNTPTALNGGGLLTPCDLPSSLSPVRPAVVTDSKTQVSNGHYPHFSATAATAPSEGDLNDNNLVDHHVNKNNNSNNNNNNERTPSSTASSSSSSSSHPLFLFGVCRWPGCESPFDDLSAFTE